MRTGVLTAVRARLRVAGVELDPGDLEACYSQAFHGLYATVLEGRTEIDNQMGWLVRVTHRRALDEHRTQVRHRRSAAAVHAEPGAERDLAQELDDHARLRQLMEGLRARLSPREREAAALCYLQGLSRADAAARMGITPSRMRKLMDGTRPGSPGVAGRVGELLETIRAGSFCAEQASSMRALAFGILDPEGERYALAQAHRRRCPACRAYVLSLRGLASVLPAPPLPLALGAGVATGAGAGAAAGGSAGTATVAGAGAAAGGGWAVAGGGLGAKLAIGCLLAVGVGGGCVALTTGGRHLRRHPEAHRDPSLHVSDSRLPDLAQGVGSPIAPARSSPASPASPAAARRGGGDRSSHALTPASTANREFGPEQPATAGSHGSLLSRHARTARFAGRAPAGAGVSSTVAGAAPAGSAPAGSSRSRSGSGGPDGPSAAEREFGVG